MKILIADDNAAMRSLIRKICQSVSQDIFECADGIEAIACFQKIKPDWVLMDILMPCMDGLKAAEQIKVAFPQAQIIIVTEFDSKEYRMAARRAGAVHFLGKDNLTQLPNLLM